jgi:hypothetical protein
MKEVNIKNLITKYKLGTSSLKEEQFLFDNLDDSEPAIEATSVFSKMNKKEIPDNFNDKLWADFEEKNFRKNRFRIGILSAAASIILIFSLYMSNLGESKLTTSDKVALLNEAKQMFSDAEETLIIHNIIIESDLIVVYTKVE